MNIDITIVIPVGPKDVSWRHLAKHLPENFPVIWSIGENDLVEFELALAEIRSKHKDIIVTSPSGRSNQLNKGAEESSTSFIWFLHADSEVSSEVFQRINSNLSLGDKAIWYFDLYFTDGIFLMKLNEIGIKFRSRFLNLPFGDQGLILSKKLFGELGGFPNTTFGEDLIFVRQASQKGVKIKPLNEVIGTSARKYHKKWFKTTMSHLYWSYKLRKQADRSLSNIRK